MDGALGLMVRSAKQQPESAPAVIPRPEQLPLNDPAFSWERFEAFCRDLVAQLPGVGACHHYGARGDDQAGIDLVAEMKDGRTWALQCKRYSRFTARNAERAIEEASFRADHYTLLLSCEATRAVRDVFAGRAGWTIWDVRDISQKVRELPVNTARRLIDTHFGGGWPDRFLGLRGLAPFVSPEEFFGDLLDPTHLFNHTWGLVGRETALRQLADFVGTPGRRVALLVGRGGIGKTRLLRAFAEEIATLQPGVALWFLARGVQLTADNADELPHGPCVIVVDDAHEREDLGTLLALARLRSRQSAVQVVLAARPHGIDHLRSQLTMAGIDPSETLELAHLGALERDPAKALARQALGEGRAYLAAGLAAATADSPLVTVVGGRLLADEERGLSAHLLERDADFRAAVLGRFSDVLIGHLSELIEPQLCRKLLHLLAALGPVRLDEESLREAMAAFLGLDTVTLTQHIDALESGGILLRRGRTLRITPDALADHLLHQACVTSQGRATGYARQVFDRFAAICPAQLLGNLAELDWRLHYGAGQEPDLLADIWRAIDDEFRAASHAARCRLLDVLSDVAYHQPRRMLGLVSYAMRHPSAPPDTSEWSQLRSFTQDDVLHKLPGALRRIGYTLEYLPRCCDLLWELGRDDGRPTNQHPDHAMRVLADLAGYEPYKPLAVNAALLAAVERWLAEHDAHQHAHSPLDVLDALLAKSGLSSYAEGFHFVNSPFLVDREAVRPLRDRALSLVAECAGRGDIKVVLRAIASLETALTDPEGYFGQPVPDEARAQWLPEQLVVLDQLAQLAANGAEPLVPLRVMEAVAWHVQRSWSDEVRLRARGIIESIPESFELLLTRVLSGDHTLGLLEDDDERFDPGRYGQREEVRRRLVATELLARHPEPADAVRFINGRLQDIGNAGVSVDPGQFIGALATLQPAYAAGMAETLVESPDSPLAASLNALLFAVRAADEPRALDIVERAVATGHRTLCRAVAHAYQWSDWAQRLTPADLDVINHLLAHADLDVRAKTIGSLRRLGQAQPQLAISLAVGLDIAGETRLAEALCEVFDARWGVKPELLSDEELRHLLAKLEPVPSLESYHIGAFLGYAAGRLPGAVIELLLNRIERDARDEDRRYRPLPESHDIGLQRVADSAEYPSILRAIRDRMLRGTWQVRWWLPRLFVRVAAGFGPASLEILGEWVDSGDPDRIEAASRLLSDAPRAFAFEHADFAVRLLEQAERAGDECYRQVMSNLYSSATGGVRSRSLGQPSPDILKLEEQASAAAATLLFGSPGQRFYASLVDHARDQLRRDAADDEELA